MGGSHTSYCKKCYQGHECKRHYQYGSQAAEIAVSQPPILPPPPAVRSEWKWSKNHKRLFRYVLTSEGKEAYEFLDDEGNVVPGEGEYGAGLSNGAETSYSQPAPAAPIQQQPEPQHYVQVHQQPQVYYTQSTTTQTTVSTDYPSVFSGSGAPQTAESVSSVSVQPDDNWSVSNDHYDDDQETTRPTPVVTRRHHKETPAPSSPRYDDRREKKHRKRYEEPQKRHDDKKFDSKYAVYYVAQDRDREPRLY